MEILLKMVAVLAFATADQRYLQESTEELSKESQAARDEISSKNSTNGIIIVLVDLLVFMSFGLLYLNHIERLPGRHIPFR